MNTKFSDLQTAQDIEKLCNIINEALEKAEVVLKKANNVDEMRLLISEIEKARLSLDLTVNLLQEKESKIEKLESSVAQDLLDSQQLHDELEKLKQLPHQLAELGLDQQLLVSIQNHLSQLQNIKESIEIHKKQIEELILEGENQYKKYQKYIDELNHKNKENSQEFISNLELRTGQIRQQLQAELSEAQSEINGILKEAENQYKKYQKYIDELNHKNKENSQEFISNLELRTGQIRQQLQIELSKIQSEIYEVLQEAENQSLIIFRKVEEKINLHEKEITKLTIKAQNDFNKSQRNLEDLTQENQNKLKYFIVELESTNTKIHEQLEVQVSQIEVAVNELFKKAESQFATMLKDLMAVENESQRLSKINIEYEEKLSNLLIQSKQQNQQSKEEFIEITKQAKQEFQLDFKQAKDQYAKATKKAKEITNNIELIIDRIGGKDNVQKILTEISFANAQLEESKQKLIAVRSLEDHILELQKMKNHKYLRNLLWKEFGFIGMIIYVLKLLIRSN